MRKTLGIYVSSDQHLDKLIRVCRAAKKRDVGVQVFLTHIGTRLSIQPGFKELTELAEVAICRVGFKDNRLERPIEGLDEKAFATQSWHAEMILNCDRYLTF